MPGADIFQAVDRSRFVPEFFLPPDGPLSPTSRWRRVAVGDPEYAEGLVRDEPLVTKVVGGLPVSSSTRPSLMRTMLDVLDPPAGGRVLEIGTGTGYNAALLAQLAGRDGWVVSVEVDPDVAAAAATRLRPAGVSVVCADGLEPFARRPAVTHLIATCGCRTLWAETAELVEEGGVVVLPLVHGLDGAWCPLHHLVRRDEELVGRVAGWTTFMPSRGPVAEPVPGGGVQLPSTPPDRQRSVPAEVSAIVATLQPPDEASLRYYLSVALVSTWRFDGVVGLERAGYGRAELLISSGTMHQWGDDEVAEQLLDAVLAWDHLGRPDPFHDYEVVIHRPGSDEAANGTSPGRWHVPRGPLTQTVVLVGEGRGRKPS